MKILHSLSLSKMGKSLKNPVLATAALTLSLGLAQAQSPYCTPDHPELSGNYITDVSTTGGRTNISNSTGMSASGYADYTSQKVTVQPGESFDLSISLSTYDAAGVWIDWNNNNDLDDPGERVLTPNNYFNSPNTITIDVPNTVSLGDHRMRIRAYWLNENPGNPCTSSYAGEAEDYTVRIVPPPSCDTTALPAAITAMIDKDTLCVSGDVTLSLDTVFTLTNLTYQWQQSDNGSSNWTDVGHALSSHSDTTLTGVSDNTWYRCILFCHSTGKDTTNVVSVVVNNPQITSVRNGSICGDSGRVLLAAYGNDDAPFFGWYASEDATDVLGYGSSFLTPVIHQTDTFWVAPGVDTPFGGTAMLGTGTSVSTSEYSPFVTNWGSNNVQMMFSASELNAEGLTGGTVSQLVFDVATATTVPLKDFEIKLGTTSQSALNSRVSGMTVVYSSSAQPIAAGLDTFNLTTPFEWDGTSNLVVEVCHNNHNTGNGSANGKVHYTTTSNTSVYYNYDDNPSYNMCSSPGSSLSSSTTKNRANIQFTISNCTGPRVPVVATVTSGNAPTVDLGDNSIVCADATLDAGNSGSSYYWNTGDTTQTIGQQGVGTYWVAVTNSHGCTATDTTEIDSITALAVAGSIDVNNGGVAGDFFFSSVGDQNATHYEWDFGDQYNNTATGASAAHAYGEAGTYTVTLIVSNDCGADTITKKITVTDGTGIQAIHLGEDQLSLFPNPATNQVTLKNYSDFNMKTIVVYNLLGQKVLETNTNNAKVYQLNTSSYASGIYNVRIIFDNGNWISRKFEIRK